MSDRKEYIERGALLRDIEGSVVISRREVSPSGVLRGAVKVLERIRVAPAADVVEVVRCKDCKHYDGKACELLSEDADQYSTGHSTYMDDNDYCSYGERKDEC